MKPELTSYDICQLLKELQFLVGGRINKVYQSSLEEVLLLIHVPAHGRQLLRIALPSLIYVTQFKSEMPDRPLGFCRFLRKHIHNAYVTKFCQHDFERTVVLELNTREGTRIIIVELFSHGNIIFTDENLGIISLLRPVSTPHRILRGGIKYSFPTKAEHHFLNYSYEDFEAVVTAAGEPNLAKILARGCGLGGTYAEEIIARAQIPRNATETALRKCFQALLQFREEKICTHLYKKEGKPFLLSPVPLVSCAHLEPQQFSSYNDALDSVFTEQLMQMQQASHSAASEEKAIKAESIMKQQLEALEAAESEREESLAKGNAIYAHYQELKDLLNDMLATAKKHSWKEMEQRFRNHPKVKNFVLKAKQVTIRV